MTNKFRLLATCLLLPQRPAWSLVCFLLLTHVGRGDSPVVSVRDIKDLEPALKQLTERGGEIYLAAGVHVVTKPIKIRSNITLRGAGFATKLVAGPDLNDNVIVNATGKHGNENIRILDLSIDGNRHQQWCGDPALYEQSKGNGLFFEKVDSLSIAGVKIENCNGSGVFLGSQCTAVNIDKSIFRKNRLYGIEIEGSGSSDIVISCSTIKGNMIGGLVARGPQFRNGPVGLRMIGCNIEDHRNDTGVKCAGLQDTILVGNRIDKAIEAGVEVRHMKRFVFSGNIITRVDDGQAGYGNGAAMSITGTPFDTDYANKHVLLGNNIFAECMGGPYFEASSNEFGSNIGRGYVVIGNISADHVRVGLAAHQTKGVVVVGNMILDVGGRPSAPGAEIAGIVLTDRTEGYTVMGNVIYDLREERRFPSDHGIRISATKNTLIGGNLIGMMKQEPCWLNPATARDVLLFQNLINCKPSEERFYGDK
ncbi:MAG: right-handed parallel beta-helix repeat-containing protein [Verrucomicrobia bacterium]|nr:right-handed parallel beta-helix repeat-containing protein [Verrucomicrobiota bacterium]